MAQIKVGQAMKLKGENYYCVSIQQKTVERLVATSFDEWRMGRDAENQANTKFTSAIFTTPPQIEEFGIGDIVRFEENKIGFRRFPPNSHVTLDLITLRKVTVVTKGEQDGTMRDNPGVDVREGPPAEQVAHGPSSDADSKPGVL